LTYWPSLLGTSAAAFDQLQETKSGLSSMYL
jgi:hypothetical protein